MSQELALFTEDDARPDHDLGVVPVCRYCNKQGEAVMASDTRMPGQRKYQHGDPWWPMVMWALLALGQHQEVCADNPNRTQQESEE